MAIALYARKSIERENSISCETQLEYCKACIKPDEKNEKIISFVDNGYSGGNIDRDGFRKMMRQIEKGNISKLIVYRLDRISRSLSDFVGILETLKKHNVKFVSSQEAFDTSSPYGEMIIKILMVFAEFERRSIIERVTQAYAHRSEIGLYMGGRRPYGFSLKDTIIHNIKTKMYEPRDVEVNQLKYIFENYAVANVSLRRLMDNLISNNILPTEGSWSTARLSTIIKNPIYVKADNSIYEYYSKMGANIVSDVKEFDGIHGVQIYGKTKQGNEPIRVIVMKHHGIIDSDIWLKCQRKLERNKQIGNSISNSTSWLGGIVVCKKCGRRMTVTKGGISQKNGQILRYFNCTGKSHNRICSGSRVTIYADSLEDMIYELVSERLAALKGVRKKVSTDNANQINLLKNRIAEIKISQDKIVSMLLNDRFENDMISILNDKAKALSEERKKLIDKIGELECKEDDVISMIDLSKRWTNTSYENRKAVCHLLIHSIVVDEDGSCEVIWNL